MQRTYLRQIKILNVVVSNNDEMAIGAVLAGRKLGLKDEDLIIVGLDATPDALDYLGKRIRCNSVPVSCRTRFCGG